MNQSLGYVNYLSTNSLLAALLFSKTIPDKVYWVLLTKKEYYYDTELMIHFSRQKHIEIKKLYLAVQSNKEDLFTGLKIEDLTARDPQHTSIRSLRI